ncbi:MAG: hypothetical protein WBF99_01215 [Xanthobacteraceae bacterium]
MIEGEAQTLALYKRLIKEIRKRIDATEAIVNRETGLEARFAREAAYLQLRMICEAIALGCVIAHEGFSELKSGKLQNSYAADQIVNVLAGLHDRFYPQPVQIARKAPGRITIQDDEIEHLTKEDLKALYRKCGGVLHRGTPKSLVAGEKIEKDWITYVMKQAQLIVNLLASHALVMHGDQRSIFCNFASGEAWIAKAR